jgi:preprotein translocase subunit SecD
MNAKFATAILFLAAQVALAVDPSAFEIHAVANTPSASAKEYSFPERRGEKETILVDQKVLLDASAVTTAKLERGQSGEFEVTIILTETGARRFQEITTEFTGKRLAIFLAGKLEGAPSVREPISGGSLTISGGWSEKQATEFVSLLNKAVQQ